MTAHTIDQLALYGPDRCEAMSVQDARRWCAQLAKNHYENFSVLTSVVPGDLRGDFAVVYAFCRWSDDLGDEVGDRARATDLLAWWRQELRMCFEGNPRHPVFVALQPTITQHALEMQPFADLISAFEMDQRVTRYQTWDELIGYCKLSANPVGRLVLGLFDELKGADASRKLKASDQICTALQLTNHIQDIKRDFLERDRIYVPREMINIDDFESRLRASAKQGFGIDQNFLGETRVVIRECVERTWKMFEDGGRLLDMVGERARPVIWLLASGGIRVLRMIEQWNYETALHRPKLGSATRMKLLARAWMAQRGWWAISKGHS